MMKEKETILFSVLMEEIFHLRNMFKGVKKSKSISIGV